MKTFIANLYKPPPDNKNFSKNFYKIKKKKSLHTLFFPKNLYGSITNSAHCSATDCTAAASPAAFSAGEAGNRLFTSRTQLSVAADVNFAKN